MKKLSLLIATALIAVTAMVALPASADAHGWHWTACTNNGRWIKGHSSGNWYGPWWGCGGNWAAWEYYYTTKIWP